MGDFVFGASSTQPNKSVESLFDFISSTSHCTMTNVTASNSSISPNVHNSVINQQTDDLLPSISSLTFNVTGTDNADQSTVNASNAVRSNIMNDDVTGSSLLSESSINLLNPILNNNTVDSKDKKLEANELSGNSAAELLTVLTSTAANNGPAISPVMSAASQVTLPTFDYSTNSDENPVVSMWSSVDDGNNIGGISTNGFKTSPVGGGGVYPNS